MAERMSAGVPPVAVDTTLVEAAERMRASGLGALALADGEGACVGVLTERDIVVRVLAEGREPRPMHVRDVATMEPVTCGPEEELEAAVERMRANRVQHLPVVEAGRLVGMLSLADVVFERPDEQRGAFEPGSAGRPRPPATERAAGDDRRGSESVENPAPPGDDAPSG